MSDNTGQVLIYRTPIGTTEIEVSLNRDTVWLTQKQISELFQKDSDTIGLHIKNIYQEQELIESATTEKNSVVQKEGSRLVKRDLNFYNLDVIISVGYRVNSVQGTHFRIWATNQLREFMVKGFVLDDAKLKGEKSSYFDELHERVRAIRTSEKNFWEKIKDIFAFGSIDYEPNAEIAKTFFATVQNMFHYAIHGHTAAELIKERADSHKEYMGLKSFKGDDITQQDVKIAKNYLTELEIKRLNLLSDQFLSFAELQSVEKRPMYMSTWVVKLIDFLRLNEKPILTDAGKVSKSIGEQIALQEYAKYEEMRKDQSKKLKKFLTENSVETDFAEQGTPSSQKISSGDPEFDNVMNNALKKGKPPR